MLDATLYSHKQSISPSPLHKKPKKIKMRAMRSIVKKYRPSSAVLNASKAVLLSSLILFTGCQKDRSESDQQGPDLGISTSQESEMSMSSAQPMQSSSTSGHTLTVTMKSNRTLKPGSTYSYLLQVTKNGKAVSNYTIGIDDAILGRCIDVKTNSKGEIEFTERVPSWMSPAVYIHRFYIPNAQGIVSSVGVSSNVQLRILRGFTLSMKSSKQNEISRNNAAIALKATMFDPSGAELLPALKSFGNAVYEDLVSNPYNKAVVTVAQATCPAAAIPPAGAACELAVTYLAPQIGASAAKVMMKRIVAVKYDKNSKEYKLASDLIDAAFVGFSVTKFAKSGGIDAKGLYELMATGWDYKQVEGNFKKDSNGKVVGMYFVGVIKTGNYKDQMCVMTVQKR